ncbi:MAG: CRISPR-associated endonuclease Cas2 [Succinivibrio sp.]|nr:CRISPR-associated endonuclease Cas2 [Succinivibrio sp.]
MSFRYMRVLVMFDLPVDTPKDRKNYRLFRMYLVKSGFIMMQESIYCKLALNTMVANSIAEAVRKHKPPVGLVQMMIITERQFSKIEFIVGQSKSDVINSTDRYIEL